MYVLLSIVIILLTLLYIFIPTNNQFHNPDTKTITPPQETEMPVYTRNDYNSINNLVQVSQPHMGKTQLKGPQVGVLGEDTIYMKHLLQEYGDLQTYGLQ